MHTCQPRVDDKRSSNGSDAELGGVSPRGLPKGLNIAPLECKRSCGIWCYDYLWEVSSMVLCTYLQGTHPYEIRCFLLLTA